MNFNNSTFTTFWIIPFRYLRGWFVIDLISSLPVENIMLIIDKNSDDLGLGLKSASRALKFLKLTKLLSLLKLLRLSRMTRYVVHLKEVSYATLVVSNRYFWELFWQFRDSYLYESSSLLKWTKQEIAQEYYIAVQLVKECRK